MSELVEHHLGEDLLALAEGGGALSGERKKELEEHVLGCAECRQAIAGAKLVLRAVDAAPLPEPSPAFDAALYRRLDAIDLKTGADALSFIDRLRAFFTLPRIGIAATATAAAAIAIGIFVGTRPTNDPKMMFEIAQNLEGLRVADNFDLYRNLEVVENLDVLDDLDTIQALAEESG